MGFTGDFGTTWSRWLLTVIIVSEDIMDEWIQVANYLQ